MSSSSSGSGAFFFSSALAVATEVRRCYKMGNQHDSHESYPVRHQRRGRQRQQRGRGRQRLEGKNHASLYQIR